MSYSSQIASPPLPFSPILAPSRPPLQALPHSTRRLSPPVRALHIYIHDTQSVKVTEHIDATSQITVNLSFVAWRTTKVRRAVFSISVHAHSRIIRASHMAEHRTLETETCASLITDAKQLEAVLKATESAEDKLHTFLPLPTRIFTVCGNLFTTTPRLFLLLQDPLLAFALRVPLAPDKYCPRVCTFYLF